MEKAHIANLVEFALVAAARENFGHRELGEIHLLKVLYLADLAHAKVHMGETLTGVPWIFHGFGPWDVALHTFLASLLATATYQSVRRASVMGEYTRYAIAIEDEDEDEDKDSMEARFRALERGLTPEVASAVKWTVRQFGSDTQSLLHHVYKTEPMLRAAPEERLDFSGLGAAPSTPVRVAPSEPAAPLSKTQARKAEDAKRQSKERIKTLLQQKREARKANALPLLADPDYVEIMGLLEQDDAPEARDVSGEMDVDAAYWRTGIRRLFDVSG